MRRSPASVGGERRHAVQYVGRDELVAFDICVEFGEGAAVGRDPAKTIVVGSYSEEIFQSRVEEE